MGTGFCQNGHLVCYKANVDDEEMAEYIKNCQRSGNPVTERDLIGQWERKARGSEDYYYEFLENDSVSLKKISHYANSFYNGDILWIAKYGGKWHIKGDSLIIAYDAKSAEIQLDRSQVTYRPDMRDSVERFISRYFDEKKITEEMRKQLELHPQKDTFCVTINKAHDKLEVGVNTSEDEVSTRYFKRIKDNDVFKR